MSWLGRSRIFTHGQVVLQGPYTSTADLEDKPGVYAVFCLQDGERRLLDVRCTGRVRAQAAIALSSSLWRHCCHGLVQLGVVYTSDPEEMESVRKNLWLCPGNLSTSSHAASLPLAIATGHN